MLNYKISHIIKKKIQPFAPLIALEFSVLDENLSTKEVREAINKIILLDEPVKNIADCLHEIFKGRLYYSKNDEIFYLICPKPDLSNDFEVKSISALTLKICINEVLSLCLGKMTTFFFSTLILNEMKKN